MLMGRIWTGRWLHRQPCRWVATQGPRNGVRGWWTLAVGPKRGGGRLCPWIGVGGTDAVLEGRLASVVSGEQEVGHQPRETVGGLGDGRGMAFKTGRWSSHL